MELQPVQRFVFVDARTGTVLGDEAMRLRLAQARAVVVGEQHDDVLHHALQTQVMTQVAQLGRAVLGLEMLPWTYQPQLDALTGGELTLAALPAATAWDTTWGFPFALFEPTLEVALAKHAPVVALNAPRSLIKAVRKLGTNGLSEDDRAMLPEIDLSDDEHRRWFFGLGLGHMASLSSEEREGFYRAQVTWDEAMAATAFQALQQHPGARIVILAGTGHIARGRGIPQRLLRRMGGDTSTVLSLYPITIAVDEPPQTTQQRLREAQQQGEGDIIVVCRDVGEVSL
jgi:uncharacterized iron-regulated protein